MRSRASYLKAFVAFNIFFKGGKISFKSDNLNILIFKARKNGFIAA
jgi:hypothetical protein